MFKTLFTSTVMLLIVFTAFSQEIYHRTRIWLHQETDLKTLSDLGVDVRQGTYKQNTFLETDCSESELELIKNSGFSTEILIENVSNFYEEQGKIPAELKPRNSICQNLPSSTYAPKIPENFTLGTFGGYFKTQEMFDILSNMRTLYPNLISESFSVSDTLTHEGRTIYGWRISNNPDVVQDKPKVLYTALIHAREPATLSTTLFYMWYLLENYGTDPEATFLVDNTELYFVPLLNPDGYARNEQTNPNGGGMHRKNRNPNHGTTNRGVDLNRNFPYLWGTTGVSFNQNSDTYPGTGPISEPESKVFKKIAEQWGVSHAFNAHTHGRLLLFPIGATSDVFAVDHDYFDAVTQEMVIYNNYEAIKSSGLYPASGDTDDFMYLDYGIFAMTPEIGGAFWSPQNEIVDDCIDMLYSNLTLSHLPHVYGKAKETDESIFLTNSSGVFNHNVRRLGQQDGTLTVSIEPVQGIASVGSPVSYSDLSLLQNQNGSIGYTLNSNINPGDLVIYTLNLDNGSWIKKDTITKIFGLPELQFYDNAQNVSNWTGTFATTTSSFVSSPSSLTDSPVGNYSANANRTYQLNQTIDLTNASRAVIRFYTRWFIEADWDYVQFQVSKDNGASWEAQCGKYTVPGKSNSQNTQPVGKPLYDGTQADWVLEEMDMSEYLGQVIQVRFQLRSDGNTQLDGFYFDDFQVHYDLEDDSSIDTEDGFSIRVYPNPAQDFVQILCSSPMTGKVHIVDAFGREIETMESLTANQHFSFSTKSYANGIYYMLVENQKGQFVSTKFSVVR
jgi:murein tripeptide amidase MpaA